MPTHEVNIASADGGDSTIDDTQKLRDAANKRKRTRGAGLLGAVRIHPR